MAVTIRPEKHKDKAALFAINKAAFETDAEAKLVDALHERAKPIISLVAEVDNQIVGNILFSPVTLEGHEDARVMGLAPMAVLPKYQRSGIGSELVRAGLERCNQLGFGAVVVLGHPNYYPRFGFEPSTRFGINSEYDVQEEVFMALELQTGYLDGRTGIIKYHVAFGEL